MRCSRNSFSLLRNSFSCGDIIATGDVASAGAAPSAAAGASIGRDAADRLFLLPAPSEGAISAFSTFTDPQAGQDTSPRFACLS